MIFFLKKIYFVMPVSSNKKHCIIKNEKSLFDLCQNEYVIYILNLITLHTLIYYFYRRN